MSADHNITGTIYRGFRRASGDPVIIKEDRNGHPTGTVRHLPKHSPTGMNWGYAGSGPADTARSLLIEALGEDAICPVCAGTGRVVYVRSQNGKDLLAEPFDPERHTWTARGWICKCDQGYRQLPYPSFASQYVIRWGKEWTMSRADILNWLSSANQTGSEPDAD